MFYLRLNSQEKKEKMKTILSNSESFVTFAQLSFLRKFLIEMCL